MDILDVFGNNGGDMGVTEVARRLSMNKSTVTRVMATLEGGGYLYQLPDTRKYRLGSKILTLSSMMLSKMDLRTVASPRLQHLSSVTNESVALWITDDDLHRLCIARFDGTQELKTAYVVGSTFTLHAGAAGKVLLAFLPEEDQEKVFKRMQSSPKELRVVDKNALRHELKIIREQGYSLSVGEVIDIFSGVGAPVRDQSGKVVAAIGISGLSTRFTPETIKKYSQLAKETGLLISQELGYRGNPE